MEGLYIVVERPYVQEFLDYIFQHFNVSVWTAATKDYASSIIKNVILTKPERKLDFVFFSYHCGVSSRLKKNSKALKLLRENFNLFHYNLNNTFIIDDLDEIYEFQPFNCIPIPEFIFENEASEKDDFLLKLKNEFEIEFSKSGNLQAHIKNINSKLNIPQSESRNSKKKRKRQG